MSQKGDSLVVSPSMGLGPLANVSGFETRPSGYRQVIGNLTVIKRLWGEAGHTQTTSPSWQLVFFSLPR